jgi:hypothetical protein
MSMRLKDEPGRLFIRTSPRLYWVVVTLFGALAVCFALTALGVVSGGKPYSLPFRMGSGVLGSLAFALGAWVCWRAPLSILVVDRAAQTVTLTRRGLFHTTVERYPADAIVDVRVTKERDGKGNPVYRVELVLHTGNLVPVSLNRPRDRAGCMRAAENLRAALGLPRA